MANSLSEVRDLLRTKLGDVQAEPFLLNYFLAEGRRELEERGNYYYMTGVKDHALVAGTQSYSLTSAVAPGLGLTNYKEQRFLFIRDVTGTQWLHVPIGSWNSSLEEFATSTSRKPEFATIENDTIYFFPTPDAAYPIKFICFSWTLNPVDVSATDELITRWTGALLAASIMVGKRFISEGRDAAEAWESAMKDQVEKLKDFTNIRLGTPVNQMSTREAAMILQASGGQPNG